MTHEEIRSALASESLTQEEIKKAYDETKQTILTYGRLA
jgi:hypothetical protein